MMQSERHGGDPRVRQQTENPVSLKVQTSFPPHENQTFGSFFISGRNRNRSIFINTSILKTHREAALIKHFSKLHMYICLCSDKKGLIWFEPSCSAASSISICDIRVFVNNRDHFVRMRHEGVFSSHRIRLIKLNWAFGGRNLQNLQD